MPLTEWVSLRVTGPPMHSMKRLVVVCGACVIDVWFNQQQVNPAITTHSGDGGHQFTPIAAMKCFSEASASGLGSRVSVKPPRWGLAP